MQLNIPLSFFFSTILILDWLAMSLSGVVGRLVSPSLALASIRVVCQSISYKQILHTSESSF